MPQVLANEFAQFARDRLRPAVDKVQASRRSGLLYAFLAAACLFAVFLIVVYASISPFRGMLDENSIAYWPLLILAPLAFTMVGFSLVYILLLRRAVKTFRRELIGRIAEFIDPGLVHEELSPISDADLQNSLLFRHLAKPKAGPDRFRGRAGEAAVEFSDLQVKTDADPKVHSLSGIYLDATFPRRFAFPVLFFPTTLEVSRSGFEKDLRARGYPLAEGLVRLEDPSTNRQVLIPSGKEQELCRIIPAGVVDALANLRQQQGVEVLIAAFGNKLHLAMLSANERMDLPGAFEGFDFGNCRLFCHNARLGMQMARDVGGQASLFE
ncbi:MAG: hypothetical protein LUE17_00180 [Planctomycetaceae bacterium]|nr:hypothetical protein [Planctomycetaceae bacterium]